MFNDLTSCNKCGSENDYTEKSFDGGFVSEAVTKCVDCGFEDYWSYGHFDSAADGLNKCRKYEWKDGVMVFTDP